MIIELVKVSIDTDGNWESHRKDINKETHCFCNDDKPVQWFTQKQGREGHDRFYHLHYNKDGSQLKKIDSWDDPPDVYKQVKKVKGEKEVCYFTKQDEKLEYCMVTEKDYSASSSENHTTWWKQGWHEPAHQALPIKNKPWWKFF